MGSVRVPPLRQLEALKAIHNYQLAKGYPISTRELGVQLRISTTYAHHHLLALRRRGLVHALKGRTRTLVITERGRKELEA